jgi:hypothetical protein
MGTIDNIKLGVKVQFIPNSKINNSNIKIGGLEGIIVYINYNKLIVKLNQSSISKLIDFNGTVAQKYLINKELIVIENQFIEIIDTNQLDTGYFTRVAQFGSFAHLVGAIFFFIIFVIATLISFVNTRNLLFPMPNYPGEFWAALVPGIVSIILLLVIISFVKTYLIKLRLRISKQSIEAEIIDMHYYRVGETDYCKIIYLYENIIMSESTSYSKFSNLQIGDKIKIKTIGRDLKHFSMSN